MAASAGHGMPRRLRRIAGAVAIAGRHLPRRLRARRAAREAAGRRAWRLAATSRRRQAAGDVNDVAILRPVDRIGGPVAEGQNEREAREDPRAEGECHDKDQRAADEDAPQDVALHVHVCQVVSLYCLAELRPLHQLDEGVQQDLQVRERREQPGSRRQGRGVRLHGLQHVHAHATHDHPIDKAANDVGLVWQPKQLVAEAEVQVHELQPPCRLLLRRLALRLFLQSSLAIALD
mmetsp:Transcript_87577/g.252886  ORF Transcript_87577/g.252886 Transcript_87577/m.252886 type:complete len:234 (-) Transcript_87577:311-1012(-)